MADDLLGVGEIRRLKSRFTAAAGRGSGSGQKDSFDLGLPFADQGECTKFQIFPFCLTRGCRRSPHRRWPTSSSQEGKVKDEKKLRTTRLDSATAKRKGRSPLPVCLRNLQGAVGKRLQSARTEWSSAPSWARGVGIRGATPFVKPLPLSSTQCHRSSVCAGLQEDTCYNSEAVRHGVRCTCSRVVNPVMACQQEDLFRAKKKKKREVCTLRTGSKCFCNGVARYVRIASFVNAVLVVRARLDAALVHSAQEACTSAIVPRKLFHFSSNELTRSG